MNNVPYIGSGAGLSVPLKHKQAELSGHAHTYAVTRNWISLSETLRKLGDLEQEFQDTLLEAV